MRLMDDPKYKANLFADISAVISSTEIKSIRDITPERDLHTKLVQSDYHTPVNIVIRLGRLVEFGFITPDEQKVLQEI